MAQISESRKGVGRFYALDSDSFAFVKSQLMSKAIEDALSKEMEVLGYRQDAFWKNFNSRFAESFKATEESLKSKYKIGNGATATQKKTYKQKLRHKRLTSRSKFGNLKAAISSYVVKNLSRSSSNPKSKYLVLTAKIDKNVLTQIVQKYSEGGSSSSIDKIYISLKLNLQNGDWQKLGVNYSSEIAKAVQDHWRTWFQEKYQLGEKEVIFTDSSLEESLTDKLDSRSSLLGSLNILKSDEATNSIWIRINNVFQLINDNPLLRERKIEMRSDLIALDIDANNPLHFADFPLVKMLYSYSNIKRLSSDIASKVYELPLNDFTKIRSKMRSMLVGGKRQSIIVLNSDGIADVLDLMDEMKKKFVRFQPLIELTSFSNDQAEVNIKFQGSLEELKSTVLNLSELSINSTKKVQFLNQDNPFSMTLKKI